VGVDTLKGQGAILLRNRGGMAKTVTEQMSLAEVDPVLILGYRDQNLRLMERRLKAKLLVRDSLVTIKGSTSDVRKAVATLEKLLEVARKGRAVSEDDVLYALGGNGAKDGEKETSRDLESRAIRVEKGVIRPKSEGQAQYLDAIRDFDLVFAVGPAGTGKTYLAVATAVEALRARAVERILLVRPAVEAGENLGFLPGDYQEKIDPYLRPLYDSLRDMMSYDRIRRFLELGVLEVAPLAYMRGRTLSRAYVILDEAQNTTVGQMKMFLTRLGPNSKAVVTGDVTQVDLPDSQTSGLVEARTILEGIEGIRFCDFGEADVVRHRLVKDIIKAFDAHQNKKGRRGRAGKTGSK
jgi:phosphate starvation-inducible PhoH-like protein